MNKIKVDSNIRLEDFLLTQTKAGSYAYITSGGWYCAMCFIDHEDAFIRGLSEELLKHKVNEVSIGNCQLKHADGEIEDVLVYYIDID